MSVTDRLTASQMIMAVSTLIRVAVLICQFFMTILTRTPEQSIFSDTDKPWHSLGRRCARAYPRAATCAWRTVTLHRLPLRLAIEAVPTRTATGSPCCLWCSLGC